MSNSMLYHVQYDVQYDGVKQKIGQVARCLDEALAEAEMIGLEKIRFLTRSHHHKNCKYF